MTQLKSARKIVLETMSERLLRCFLDEIAKIAIVHFVVKMYLIYCGRQAAFRLKKEEYHSAFGGPSPNTTYLRRGTLDRHRVKAASRSSSAKSSPRG